MFRNSKQSKDLKILIGYQTALKKPLRSSNHLLGERQAFQMARRHTRGIWSDTRAESRVVDLNGLKIGVTRDDIGDQLFSVWTKGPIEGQRGNRADALPRPVDAKAYGGSYASIRSLVRMRALLKRSQLRISDPAILEHQKAL